MIKVSDWPGQSLDLNPIKNMWDDLYRAVQRRFPSQPNWQYRDILSWKAVSINDPKVVFHLICVSSYITRAVHKT